jgi:hypothetical protein
MTDYLDVTGHLPADDRPRRPTPCEHCGSREVEKAPVMRHGFAVADMFSEEFNANPFPMILCAGCARERIDLYHDAKLTGDFPMGWEVWNGAAWEHEIPFTHDEPPPVTP